MNLTDQIGRLEPMVLHPLHRVNGEEWHRAPDGKWSIAQIVEHLALSVDLVARAFNHRAHKCPMRRRASAVQGLTRFVILGVGRLPGGVNAPDVAQPREQPDPELVTAQFRMGVAGLHSLLSDWSEQQQRSVFVRHPLMGDLNLREWVRFHYIHCRHHAGQLRDRLDWVRQ